MNAGTRAGWGWTLVETILPAILGLSILLQLASAVTAVCLSVRTGFYKPWILIAAAVSLMAVRRIISFIDIMQGGHIPASALGAELTALLISTLMLAGILMFGPALRMIQRRNELELEAKDMIVRETHHHVKNDLQLLQSIVTLQRGFQNTDSDPGFLSDLESRIRSISLLHEHLYNIEASVASVQFYLQSIAESISTTYNHRNVEMHLDLQDHPVSTKNLLYCGLLTNEALTNCYKHAFGQGTANPQIHVRTQRENGQLLLQVSDNGCGMTRDAIQDSSRNSYGMSLIQSLGESSGWSVVIDGSNGTSISARLPLDTAPA